MADGEFNLQLDKDLAQKLERAASAAGVSAQVLATFLLEQQLFNYDDYEWIGDDPRTTPPPPFDPDEPTIPLEEVMAEFRAELERRLASKA